jgi:hypothetical protein
MTPVNPVTIIHRKTIPCGIIVSLILVFLLLQIVFAQTQTAFKPTDKFSIPEYNGTINFATEGTYSLGNLENDSWSFVNLNLNNSQQLFNLTVSAQSCNVTIEQYLTFFANTSLSGMLLTYSVEGQGKQIFRFGLNLEGGEWSVSLNGDFVGKDEGWTVSPDETLTVIGARAASNVTIVYFNFGDNGDTSNQPVYQQHSVAISTAVVVAVVVVLCVLIWRKNKSVRDKT